MTTPADTRISDAVLDEIEAGLADAAVLLKLHEDVHKPVLRLNPAAVRAAFTELRERRAQAVTVTDEMVELALDALVVDTCPVSEYLDFSAADAKQMGVDIEGENFSRIDHIRADQLRDTERAIMRVALVSALASPPPAQSADAAKEAQAVAVAWQWRYVGDDPFRQKLHGLDWREPYPGTSREDYADQEFETRDLYASPPAPASGGVSEERHGIYIASKTKHAQRWRFLRDTVGEPIISTWIDEAGQGESGDLADLWRRCIHEASHAEVLILYREPDEVLKGGWIELGAALSAGVKVFAVGIDEFTVAHDARIEHMPDMKSAIAAQRAYRAALTQPAGKE